jgi:hypothetical protein
LPDLSVSMASLILPNNPNLVQIFFCMFDVFTK